MFNLELPLILASGSPRRKEILDLMGLSYTVDVSDADESFQAEPDKMVMELSRRKAAAVAPRHSDALVLAADTLVFAEHVLGKPQDADHARRMLEELSDRWHSVYTGITLIDTRSGRTLQRADHTRVHFCKMSAEEIEAYIASGEPFGKAGAYAIQGIGGMFIDRIEGSYTNVVGLPMAMLRDMLKQITQN